MESARSQAIRKIPTPRKTRHKRVYLLREERTTALSERWRTGWLRQASGSAAGAIAIFAVWILLGRIAWVSATGSTNAGSVGAAAAHYTSMLLIAGALAGVFGGMVAALVARTRKPLPAFGVGAASAAILAGVCAFCFQLDHHPTLGASASAWILPLVICSGIGGWGFSFALPSEAAPENAASEAQGRIRRRK